MVPGLPVKAQAEAEGLDKIFIEAGFEWRLPGCSNVSGDEQRPSESGATFWASRPEPQNF